MVEKFLTQQKIEKKNEINHLMENFLIQQKIKKKNRTIDWLIRAIKEKLFNLIGKLKRKNNALKKRYFSKKALCI